MTNSPQKTGYVDMNWKDIYVGDQLKWKWSNTDYGVVTTDGFNFFYHPTQTKWDVVDQKFKDWDYQGKLSDFASHGNYCK